MGRHETGSIPGNIQLRPVTFLLFPSRGHEKQETGLQMQ